MRGVLKKTVMAACVPVLLAGATAPAEAATAKAKPVITTVVFSGTAKAPTITITGRNFGAKPKPAPNCHPEGGFTCGDYTGYDYGTLLYVTATGGTGISAGRYRPGIGELDAISLVITKYSATKIVYHFGNYYSKIGTPRYGWLLAKGDKFTVVVRGAKKSGVVKYAVKK